MGNNNKTIRNSRKSFLILFFGFAISFFIIFPKIIFAQEKIVSSFFSFDTSSPPAWINSIYRYGIVAISLFAAAGITYGGIRYLTSGGSPEAITSAKNAIFSSISGLILLLLSHMILRTLDPRLVELKLVTRRFEVPESKCLIRADCRTNYECVEGWCIIDRDIRNCEGGNGYCTWDNCCPGYRCNSRGFFEAAICEPDPYNTQINVRPESGGVGDRCSSHEDCSWGLFCRQDDTWGVNWLNPDECEECRNCNKDYCRRRCRHTI